MRPDHPDLAPLHGLRAVEVGSSMTAAFGARLLADLGAEVIKVEPPEGDPSRASPETGDVSPAALFSYLNAGKRSVTLDTTRAEGARMLRDLAAASDILIVGIGWEGAGHLPPFLIDPADSELPTTIVVSPLGLAGERSADPSSPFVVQHSAGFAYHQACPVRDPKTTPPVAGADWESMLAAGLLVPTAALWGLSTITPGTPKPFIDLSIEDLLAYLLIEPFGEWKIDPAKAVERQRAPDEPTTVAGGLIWLLRCADGAVLVSPREDHQWARWAAVMGGPAWAFDPQTCGSKDRRAANSAQLQRKMQEWSCTLPAKEVFQLAQSNKVACFTVSTADDLLRNRQLRERRFFNRLQLPGGLEVDVPGLPFRMRSGSGRELSRARRIAAPEKGEANETFGAAAPAMPPQRSTAAR